WAAEPELLKITGLQYPALSNYMLRLNLLLIQKAPLHYLQEVIETFATYWFPSSTPLANFDSRFVQLLWGLLNFGVMGGFAFSLIVLSGATIYVKVSGLSLAVDNTPPLNALGSLEFSGLIYGLAGTIVFYTAAISCLIEIGIPRYRVPNDSL